MAAVRTKDAVSRMRRSTFSKSMPVTDRVAAPAREPMVDMSEICEIVTPRSSEMADQ